MESKCLKSPNEEVMRQLALEDLPLLRMLATNGRSALPKQEQ